MESIYHPYNLWECFNNGMYESVKKTHEGRLVISFFENSGLTENSMRYVSDNWIYSCETHLTNSSMNRIAWLGQAAVCYYLGLPNLLTMKYWNQVNNESRNIADSIANTVILEWEKKQRHNRTLIHGKKEGIQLTFQMKFQ